MHEEAEKNRIKNRMINENLINLNKRREKSFVKIFQRYDKIEQNVLIKSIERRKNNKEMTKEMNRFRELTVENRKKLSEEKQKKQKKMKKRKKNKQKNIIK